jgi:hypothetical protein
VTFKYIGELDPEDMYISSLRVDDYIFFSSHVYWNTMIDVGSGDCWESPLLHGDVVLGCPCADFWKG